jgi:membrane-associated phospholipid phosphatase
MKTLLSKISRLRLEEAIAILFLIPCAVVTFTAYFHFYNQGSVPRYIVGGMWRLPVALLFFAIIFVAAKFKDRSKIALFVREVLPFVLAIAVYTNLHDTIAFVNPGDISSTLVAIDKAIFGVEPVLWAEKFYHPVLTEFFSFCYLNFFWYSFILGMLLYFWGKPGHFRTMMLGVTMLFYAGYVFYIIFPALPPRLALQQYFTKDLSGFMLQKMNGVVNISFASSRAAFPSLHCANTLITLIYSFQYKRPFFYVFLPIATGLVLATVYLRHHYVIDILVGFALALTIYFTVPKIDKWWAARKNSLPAS